MNRACRVTSALMTDRMTGPCGAMVCNNVGSAVGMVLAVTWLAMSACATWVMRTSWAVTTEIPTDPPMLRDRLSSDAAVVRIRGASAVSYTHLRAHETPEHLVC